MTFRPGFSLLVMVVVALGAGCAHEPDQPDPAEVTRRYFERAADALRTGDPAGAMAAYTRVIELYPQTSLAFLYRGEIKRSQGDLVGALADFSQALVLDPKNVPACVARGLAETKQEDLAAANRDYSRALELDPKLTQTWYERGFVRFSQGDLEGALADYSQAIVLYPRYGQAYVCRGGIKYQQQHWTEALADFKKCDELFPSGMPYAHLYLWVVQVRLGDKAAADRDLAAYLERYASPIAEDWITQAGRFLLGRIDEARLLQAAEAPDAGLRRERQCEAYFYAGMKRLFAGDRATAEGYFRRTLATKQKTFFEYSFAGTELKLLLAAGSVGGRP